MITDMKAFVVAVREMRTFQKACLEGRLERKRNTAFHQSRAAETRVDQMLEAGVAAISTLFDETEGKP